MGEGEFYSTDKGTIQMLKQHTNWRNSWSLIIPGRFGTNQYFEMDLLFYDRTAGVGEFYRTDLQGNIEMLKQHTNWRNSWSHIVPGKFGSNLPNRDLLFYDRAAGVGEFYRTDGNGNLQMLKQHTGWRKTWSLIVPGRYGEFGSDDGLLFYDRAAGVGEFYRTDGHGEIRLVKQHTGWRNSWSLIVPGKFSDGYNTDLLFYDRAAGVGEFYRTDVEGNIHMMKQHTGWRNSWSLIVPGQFDKGGATDLLFYDRTAGVGEFYHSDGEGNIQMLKQHVNWRKTWSLIVPGKFSNGLDTDLLFYDA